MGDLFLFFCEFEIFEELQGLFDGQIGDIDDGFLGDFDGEYFMFESFALAGGAGADAHEALHVLSAVLGLGLFVESFGLGDESFPVPGVGIVGVPVFHDEVESDGFGGAVHDRIVLSFVKVFDGGEDVKVVMFCDSSEVVVAPAIPDGFVKGDGAIGDAEVFVWDDEVWVELHFDSQTMAGFTSAKGAIKGEHAWLEFFKDHAADGAGHGRGVRMFLPAGVQDNKESVCFL